MTIAINKDFWFAVGNCRIGFFEYKTGQAAADVETVFYAGPCHVYIPFSANVCFALTTIVIVAFGSFFVYRHLQKPIR